MQAAEQEPTDPAVLLQVVAGALPSVEGAVLLEEIVRDAEVLELLGSHGAKVGAEVIAARRPTMILPTELAGRAVLELVDRFGVIDALVVEVERAVELLGSLARGHTVEANLVDVLLAVQSLVEQVALLAAALARPVESVQDAELVEVRVVFELREGVLASHAALLDKLLPNLA